LADPILLEPIMRIEIETPGDYLGSIIGDLSGRRGKIVASDMKGHAHSVVAEVPLANMFNYVSVLRSLSQGRARSAMRLGRHAPVPKAISAGIIAAAC
jgi:elongation factor G